MKRKEVISHYRIVALVTILIAVAAIFVIGNRREKTTISSVSATTGVAENPGAGVNSLSLDDTAQGVSARAAVSDTISGKKVEDTPHVAVTNPLENVLRNGLPVVADFGRGTCVPCKMMQPILEKLERDFKGKASVLILDIREYSALSQKYGITLIPTQIFFDAGGEEVFRHQGFMPEEDIVSQLKKMGVE
ncbi:MAG: thioredoxin family protein [bacterium]